MTTLLYPRATSLLRCLASTTPRAVAVQAPTKAFFTTAQPLKPLRLSQQPPFLTSRTPPTIILRHAYSTSTPQSSPSADVLTWNRFFDLRKKRRYINLVASLITAATTVAIGTPFIAEADIDTWGAQLSGMDPTFVLGGVTFAVAAAGWLCGPSFGSLGFKIWAGRRGWNTLIAEKEKSFYARIKRYRADPSSSSPQNPIPDYYGEKIASVKDYRRWLKDQRAFNLKKNKNMI